MGHAPWGAPNALHTMGIGGRRQPKTRIWVSAASPTTTMKPRNAQDGRRRPTVALALGVHGFAALFFNVWFFGASMIAHAVWLVPKTTDASGPASARS